MSNHSYGPAYESLFPLSLDRNAARLVLEVGVADGSCLLAWREVFPNAAIVGMDIHQSSKAYGERIEFHIGDQRSKTDCDRVAANRQFDLIIEDATHWIGDNLLSLFFLWPYVAPGGVYVIEEFAVGMSVEKNIKAMWPVAQMLDTYNQRGMRESLIVFRKPKT